MRQTRFAGSRRLALLLSFVLIIIAGAATLKPADQRQVLAQGDSASQVLQMVNGVRASYGLSPFQYNGTLAAAAQNQANWMASTGYYSHTQTNGSTPQSRAAAVGYGGRVSENIVGGTQLTPRGGVIWWQNSPIHLNTMVSTQYTEAAVAFASGMDQNFYVLVVGRPDGSIDLSTAAGAPQVDNSAPPLVVTPIDVSEPREDGALVHTVQQGQTVWAIAARYDVPVIDVLHLNNLRQSDIVNPGDELFITLPDGYPTPEPPSTHMVEEGQSSWTIAALYEISLADLFYFNNLTEDSVIQPGDELKIRLREGEPPPPTPTPIIFHVVESGETAWTIAALYNLTLDELLAFNQLAADAMLHPGNELRVVPPATVTPIPTPTLVPDETAAPAPIEPIAVAAVVDTPAPDLQPAVVTTVAPEIQDTASIEWGRIVSTSALVISAILIAIAAYVVVVIRREKL